MPRRFPKLKVDPKTGMAVLSGIHARDLIAIFTAASLHHHDTERDYGPKGERTTESRDHAARYRTYGNEMMAKVVETNLLDNLIWVRRQRRLIDAIQKSPKYDHGYDNVPVTQLDHLGRFCRLRAARERRDQRVRIAKIMTGLLMEKQTQ